MNAQIEAGARALCAIQQPEVSGTYAWNAQFEDGRDEYRAEAQAAWDAFHPTITTAAELDALPVGSVVLDREEDAWQRDRGGWTCTDRSPNTTAQPSRTITAILGPITVLHVGVQP